MKILEGESIVPAITDLVAQASHTLVLVTTLFDPWSRLKTALYLKVERKMPVYILVRDDSKRYQNEQVAQEFVARGARLRFVEGLTANVYISEKQALFTSMNLSTTALSSWEIGTLFEASTDAEKYSQVVAFAQRLYKRVAEGAK